MVVENKAGRDSVVTLADLDGRVASLRGDTLVIRVARAPRTGTEWIVGQRARLVLDSSTVVTRSELDSWKVGYSILAGAVLILRGWSSREADTSDLSTARISRGCANVHNCCGART
jgi:hypothetical protein